MVEKRELSMESGNGEQSLLTCFLILLTLPTRLMPPLLLGTGGWRRAANPISEIAFPCRVAARGGVAVA